MVCYFLCASGFPIPIALRSLVVVGAKKKLRMIQNHKRHNLCNWCQNPASPPVLGPPRSCYHCNQHQWHPGRGWMGEALSRTGWGNFPICQIHSWTLSFHSKSRWFSGIPKGSRVYDQTWKNGSLPSSLQIGMSKYTLPNHIYLQEQPSAR